MGHRIKRLIIAPLSPDVRTLAKIGSLLVHVQEAMEEGGHWFDVAAVKSLLNEPDVREWIVAMDKLALLPKKRSASPTSEPR